MKNSPLVLLIDIAFNGGLEPRRIATDGWITPPGDPAGCIQYAGDIISDPELVSQVTCALWSESAAFNIGSIDINNVDGEYDELLTLEAAEARITARYAYAGQEFADTEIVWSGVVLRVEPVDRQRIRIVPDTFNAMFRRPFFAVTITDTDGKELTAPVWTGHCYQINPTVIDEATLHYQCADTRIDGITVVHSGGSPFNSLQWAYDTEKTGFTASIPPSDRVTVTGFGSLGFGSNVLPTPDFDAFTGGVPTGWTKAGAGTVDEVPGVGVRMTWSGASVATLTTTNTTTLPDTLAGWYLVKGRMSRLTSDVGLGVRFRDSGTVFNLTEVGDFARVIYVAAGLNRTVRIGTPGVGIGELVLDYLEIRKVGSNTSQLLPYAIEQIVAVHGPLRYDQIDAASITALTTAANKTVGYFQSADSNTTIERALFDMMAGWTGWSYIDELGQFKVGRLEEASGTPALYVVEDDIVGGVTRRLDLAPKLADRYAGRKNWSPYTESELAGIAIENPAEFIADYRFIKKGTGTLHQTYAAARRREPVGTLISGSEAQVQYESSRINALYAVERHVYDLAVSLDDPAAALKLQIGSCVRLTYPRYGLDAGRDLLLIGKRCRFRSGLVRLTLWG